MSNPYFAYDNIVPGATISARTESSTYPAGNLTKHRLWPGYRSSADQCLVIAGVNEYGYVADHADFDITGDLTIEAIIYIDSSGSGNRYIVHKLDYHNGYGLRINSLNNLQLFINGLSTDANTARVQTNDALPLNTFIRVKAVYDASANEVVFYLDEFDGNGTAEIARVNNSTQTGGSLSGTIPSSITANAVRLTLGADQLGSNLFIGKFVSIGIAAAEHDNVGYLDPASSAGYWNFRGDLSDESGNGHTLGGFKALDLNGVDEYAYIPTDQGDFDLQSFTMEFDLINPNYGGAQVIAGKFAGGANWSYAVHLSGGDLLVLLTPDGTHASRGLVRFTNADLLNWHRYKIVVDLSVPEVSVFIDHTEVARANNSSQTGCTLEGTLPTSLFNSSYSFHIGRHMAGDYYFFAGSLGFLAVDSGASDNGNSLSPTSCTAYWQFQGNLNDSSGHGHTLTGNNISSADYVNASSYTYSNFTFTNHWLGMVLSTSKSPTHLFIDRRHNLSNGATVRLMRGDWHSNSAQEGATATVAADQSIIITLPSAPTADTHWWLSIDDPDNPDGYIEIPYVYLGSKVVMNRGFLRGYRHSERRHGSMLGDSVGGYTAYVRSEELWEADYRLRTLTSDLATVRSLASVAGLGRPFVFSEDGSVAHARLVYWPDALAPPYTHNVGDQNFIDLHLREAGGGI